MTEIEKYTEQITLALYPEEGEYLLKSPRCDTCGHKTALHNYHCCSFCMVPGCSCID